MAASDLDQILRPRKGKWMLILLVSVVFVVGGFFMLRNPGSARDRIGAEICIGFFGLGILVSLAQFVPGSSFLRLTPEGMDVRSMWRTKAYRWSDIERFGVAEFSTIHGGVRQRHRMIGYDFSPSYPEQNQGLALRSFNRRLSGFEAALPDNYGWSYEALAEHLNTLRNQYLGLSSSWR
jgi:hypothetical protein